MMEAEQRKWAQEPEPTIPAEEVTEEKAEPVEPAQDETKMGKSKQ